MPEHPSSFRDFGILPENLPPPPDKVRCFLSSGRIVGQYVGTAIVSSIAVGFLLLFALLLPLSLGLLACAATLAAFGAVLYLATHNDYRWVELEGNTLRAQHLYTGRVVERSLEEIDSLGTMIYQVSTLQTSIIEKLLGRVKGIEIRFRDRRTPLRVMRADPAMTNAQALIEAVLYRMGRLRKLDAEVINLEGQPLVRQIYWKGEQPNPPPSKNAKIILGCLMGLAWLFGMPLAMLSGVEHKRYALGSVPPQEMTLQALIDNGPGSNRHVTVTDFRPGGYAVESKSSSWTRVWIALFPAGGKPDQRKEIKVVLDSNTVRDEAALRQLVQPGRVTGICSEKPSSWGGTLGSNLVQANQGCTLSSAWEIEEMSEPPSAAKVVGLTAGAGGCFAVVLLLALILFWKAG